MASRYPGKTWPGARWGQEDISGFPSRCLPSTYTRGRRGQNTTIGVLEPGATPPPHSVFLWEPSAPPGHRRPRPAPSAARAPGVFHSLQSEARRSKRRYWEHCGSFHYVPTSNFNTIISAEDLRGTGASGQSTPAAAASVFCLDAAENIVAISYARLISLKAACGQVKWTSP